jgi:pilus assembly protein Flp/PilA
MIKRLCVEEEGQILIEYGLLTAMFAVVGIAVVTIMGTKVKDTFITVNNCLITTS